MGTDSERDAIGAKLEVICKNHRVSQWVVAGDGYLCRNENVNAFGLGDANRVDELRVRWPDGETQSFKDLPVNQRILVVESQPNAFSFSPGNPIH
ncbi:ASPIC/UnbV domain-containing protein [Rubripirellula sp.]|nr:ASPIC/UnbV domain-containing protein [Rubripirellula sp.]